MDIATFVLQHATFTHPIASLPDISGDVTEVLNEEEAYWPRFRGSLLNKISAMGIIR